MQVKGGNPAGTAGSRLQALWSRQWPEPRSLLARCGLGDIPLISVDLFCHFVPAFAALCWLVAQGPKELSPIFSFWKEGISPFSDPLDKT